MLTHSDESRSSLTSCDDEDDEEYVETTGVSVTSRTKGA